MRKQIIIALSAILLCTFNVFSNENHLPTRTQTLSGKAATESASQALGLSMMKWGVAAFLVVGALAYIIPNSGTGNGTHSH